ncbi:hypothetical protein GIB67_016311 [Kingdonia uniflora]|uniref:Homeobox domain-containing protein n=1 Tax=Kingdonia uniflora TaxID=39325 RepID=A0A7J7M9E1_9MAGN|nr:hypothetical protein GIB67_016311 [Kingdonia uniflora]
MKVHKLTRGLWEHEPSSLTLSCKRLRPLAPKLTTTSHCDTVTALDLKSFIRADSGPRKVGLCIQDNQDLSQMDLGHSGGTRWNPMQEQIGILEMLYKGGMRTPNAQQIEHITSQLSKFGKIEGKNVFYWFQNHKARERQKQKRHSLGLIIHSPKTPSSISLVPEDSSSGEVGKEEDGPYKRKQRSWQVEYLDDRLCGDHDGDKILELFPLHPEGR